MNMGLKHLFYTGKATFSPTALKMAYYFRVAYPYFMAMLTRMLIFVVILKDQQPHNAADFTEKTQEVLF